MNSKNICSRCILDDSIQEINFDENNICNFCHIHDEIDKKYELNEKTKNRLNGIINKIKTKGKNKKYDCIVGVSGGSVVVIVITNTHTHFYTILMAVKATTPSRVAQVMTI